MGIDKFYVFLDDDDEKFNYSHPDLILIQNWKDRVGFKWDDSKDEPLNRNEKQRLAFEEGSRMAQIDGIDYIIHIDSDELLYGNYPSQVFQSRPDAGAFHFQNEELAPDRTDYKNCFLEGVRFHSDKSRFTAYGNGKAAGVVGEAEWNGPHYLNANKTAEIPSEELKVLHYPSCNLDETQKRAKQYGSFTEKSGKWSENHKKNRELNGCIGFECQQKAEEIFSERMADENSKRINPFSQENWEKN